MMRSFLRAGVAPAAIVALSTSASGALSASVNLEFQIQNVDGYVAYGLYPFVTASGFSDPADPGNEILVNSPNGLSYGTSGTIGSAYYNTLGDAVAEAEGGVWSIEITDGATATVRTFEFEVGVDVGLTEDYFRVTTPVGFNTGDIIPATPTFEWAYDAAVIPEAEFDYAIPTLQGPAFDVGSIASTDTSWTPAISPLAPNTYFFALFMRNYANVPGNLVSFDSAVPTDGGEDLETFDTAFFVGSKLIVQNLTVVPAPGTIALAGAAGLVAVRRRR